MKNLKAVRVCFLTINLLLSNISYASTDTLTANTVHPQPKNWYEKINLRGYAQIRYNRLFETNPDLKCEQCDRSWGENGGFFLRRLRLIFFGNVHEKVYIYIQPDFASSASSNNLHFAQIRDAYFDLAIDNKKEFRFRVGQSKVPFGFENMQSSQNRLPLDRHDGLNSAVANERDIGIFFYWAPEKIRKRFSYLVNSGLKGSGDYGVIGFGAYNGQTANRNEANNHPHLVGRVTYPIEFKNKQIIEPSIQGYYGRSVVTNVSAGVAGTDRYEYWDKRAAATFVIFPQPFGLQAEYNIGTGPEYNPITNTIEQKDLQGGYATASYFLQIKNQILIPFARYHYFEGGKKHELDARSYKVNEIEVGAEWQPNKNFELVMMYTMSSRRFEDAQKPSNHQSGNLLRIQAQINF